LAGRTHGTTSPVPQANEFHLLKKLDLVSAPDSKLKQAGQIIFQEFGGGPDNSYTWVELKDDLTVSLLQARLIELKVPINVEVSGSLRVLPDGRVRGKRRPIAAVSPARSESARVTAQSVAPVSTKARVPELAPVRAECARKLP
jgi:hypothetical protein